MNKIRCVTLPSELIILGIKELSKDKFNEIQNRPEFAKPHGGLWASPYTPNKEYISAWHEWRHYNMPQWVSNDSVVLKLKEDAMYWCISDQDSLRDLIDIVGEQESIIYKHSGLKLSTYIDFESASKTFDVIYLTEEGACETHMPFDRPHLNLYGWDVESVLIMSYDSIESWEYKKLDIVKESDFLNDRR